MENKDEKPRYDGVVIFNTPMSIDDGVGEPDIKTIYGFFYDKKTAHNCDLWEYLIHERIAYIIGCSRCQMKGGKIFKDKWVMPNGREIPLTPQVMNFVYKTLWEEDPELFDYRIVESNGFFIVFDNEIDDGWLTCISWLNRYQMNDTRQIFFKA